MGSLMRQMVGWGVVLLGTVVMVLGYSLTLSTPLNLGKMDTVAFGGQLQQIGFMLVVGGFAAWLIVYFLREIRLI